MSLKGFGAIVCSGSGGQSPMLSDRPIYNEDVITRTQTQVPSPVGFGKSQPSFDVASKGRNKKLSCC